MVSRFTRSFVARGLLCAGLLAVLALAPASLVRAQDELGEDPIGDIALDMQLVVGDLTKYNTGDSTQETETQIVSKLDKLIEMLEKECEGCRGGRKGNNPNRPLADSIIKSGTGGIGDLHGGKKNGKDWGALSDKERERILQSKNEGFPPHYEKILERYFKRIAEETSAVDESGEVASEAGSKPKSKSEDSAASEEPKSKKDAEPSEGK